MFTMRELNRQNREVSHGKLLENIAMGAPLGEGKMWLAVLAHVHLIFPNVPSSGTSLLFSWPPIYPIMH